MKEKDVQTLFGKKNEIIGVFELKLVKKKSIPYSAVNPHQVRSLYKAEHESLYHKISDMSAEIKPFDCFKLSKVPAYVVLVWYIPRVKKTAYYIRIRDFINYRDTSARKSITEKECEFLSEYIENL